MQVNVPLVFSLWHSQMSNPELAAALGVKPSYLATIRLRFKLPLRRHVQSVGDKSESPSTDEIKARAAEIRRGWSAEERQKRATGLRRRRWTPPSYDYDHRQSVFHPV